MRSCFSSRSLAARLVALAAAFVLLSSLDESSAVAAPRWVDRAQTLPKFVFEGNAGLGVGHRSLRNGLGSLNGPGLNLEGAFGITDQVEVGLRTGIRMGNEARALQADYYGRTLWTETYGVGGSTVANPEARVRWNFYTGRVAEIGLDGRVYLPFESNTRFGAMVGVPFTFHVADFLRIDTGAYVPLVFYDDAFFAISVPAYFWFQATENFFIGPMASLRFVDPGPGPGDTAFLLGVGMGYQVASAVDLKWWFLMPDVNEGGGIRSFGGGFGVGFRIGE
jgi:hypothetical protein